jgi:Leucine-rich repeat (LRR) protein
MNCLPMLRRTALLVASILLGLGASAAQAAIPASERQALQDIYTSTNGASWGAAFNWNGAAGTECTWYGVTCNPGGTTVTSIALQSNNLTGTLPSTLNQLTNIVTVTLNNNHLTGSIPSLVGMNSLQVFNAQTNQLNGTISALASLASLASFTVNDNLMTGSIPALPASLVTFLVDHNALSGSIPALPANVNIFRANNNQLSGAIPAFPAGFLSDFDVSNNQLTGSIPSLASATNLHSFVTSNNQLSGAIPDLSALVSLNTFKVDNNQLTGSLSTLVGTMVDFEVQANQLTGSIPSLTGNTLQIFQASNNQLTGSIPPLAGLTGLFIFEVDHNQLTGSIPSVTGDHNLIIFNVSNNQLTGSIPAFSTSGFNRFDVSHNNLTGAMPALTGLSNMQYFLIGNNGLTGNVTSVPIPDALLAGQSSLCPNSLNLTPDALWDAATGQTPWYTGCTGAAGAPTATTTAATAITTTGSTLNGTVSANGASTTVNFGYGLTTAYGASVAATQSPLAGSASNAAVSVSITGLTCNTLYHFHVTANNGTGGTIDGGDLTFTTSACPAGSPSATTSAASAITQTSATLNGTATANGASTTVLFGYGLTTAYGASVAAAQSPLAGSASGAAVSASISGLNCGTLYHFHVTANNGTGGTIDGGDLNFTTAACSTSSVAPSSSQNPSNGGQSVTFTALVTGGAGTPTGTVDFFDGGNLLGTVPLDGTGQAALSTSGLSGGSHNITMQYSGDATHAPNTSIVLVQIVAGSPPVAVQNIPTLNDAGLLLLGVLLAVFGFGALRRRGGGAQGR